MECLKIDNVPTNIARSDQGSWTFIAFAVVESRLWVIQVLAFSGMVALLCVSVCRRRVCGCIDMGRLDL